MDIFYLFSPFTAEVLYILYNTYMHHFFVPPPHPPTVGKLIFSINYTTDIFESNFIKVQWNIIWLVFPAFLDTMLCLMQHVDCWFFILCAICYLFCTEVIVCIKSKRWKMRLCVQIICSQKMTDCLKGFQEIDGRIETIMSSFLEWLNLQLQI